MSNKEAVAIATNEVGEALRTLIEVARGAVERISPEEARLVGAFLAGQLERGIEELMRIATNDPGAFARFAFDMPIAAPETRRQAPPFVPSALTATRPAAPLAPVLSEPPPPPAAVPLGRLTGRRGILHGTPPAPPPMETGQVHGVGFLDESKEKIDG